MLPQMAHEFFDVIALVSTQALRMNMPTPSTGEQLARSAMFGLGGFGDQDVDAQADPIHQEHVTSIAEPCKLSVPLPHEPGFRVGCALVGGVRALLALEIDHPGTITAVLGQLTIVALEALERGPCVDQCAVNGEVIRREQFLAPGQANHLVEDAPGDVGLHQTLAQSAEGRLIQAGALEIHVKKPTKEDVVIELLAKLPVRANGVQRDQQLLLEQTLRCNQRSTDVRVKPGQVCRDRTERTVGQFLHPAQRMVGRHSRLRREIVKHRGLRVALAAHRCSSMDLGMLL